MHPNAAPASFMCRNKVTFRWWKNSDRNCACLFGTIANEHSTLISEFFVRTCLKSEGYMSEMSCWKKVVGRCFAWISTLLVFLLAPPPNASHAAGGACQPVNGRLVSQVVLIGQPLSDGSLCAASPGLFCTTGQFTGGLAGTFDFTATTLNTSANPDFALTGIAFFTGQLVLHTNHGGLVFKDAGALAIDGDVITFASVLTIIEGTGALTGTTGRIRDEGIFINGCVDCRYRGEVCSPAGGTND